MRPKDFVMPEKEKGEDQNLTLAHLSLYRAVIYFLFSGVVVWVVILSLVAFSDVRV